MINKLLFLFLSAGMSKSFILIRQKPFSLYFRYLDHPFILRLSFFPFVRIRFARNFYSVLETADPLIKDDLVRSCFMIKGGMYMAGQSNLWILTSELLKLVQQADEVYETVRSTGKEMDFYTEVKPFADKMKSLSDEWEAEAKKWLMSQKPKYIHKQQITATLENLQIIAVQAFFPKTSYSRFKQTVHSVEYVLNEVKRNVHDGESPKNVINDNES